MTEYTVVTVVLTIYNISEYVSLSMPMMPTMPKTPKTPPKTPQDTPKDPPRPPNPKTPKPRQHELWHRSLLIKLKDDIIINSISYFICKPLIHIIMIIVCMVQFMLKYIKYYKFFIIMGNQPQNSSVSELTLSLQSEDTFKIEEVNLLFKLYENLRLRS